MSGEGTYASRPRRPSATRRKSARHGDRRRADRSASSALRPFLNARLTAWYVAIITCVHRSGQPLRRQYVTW